MFSPHGIEQQIHRPTSGLTLKQEVKPFPSTVRVCTLTTILAYIWRPDRSRNAFSVPEGENNVSLVFPRWPPS